MAAIDKKIENMEIENDVNTMNRKIIYVYKKNYKEEDGFIKIGDASMPCPNMDCNDNSLDLIKIAEDRIYSYDRTSDIEVLYATMAVTNNWKSFRDYDVHRVLERSGIPKQIKGRSREWFKANLEQAKAAINAVKNELNAISQDLLHSEDQIDEKIEFRPEQEEAIKKTIKVFKNKNEMLWNAKMRFGKTLCALELIKRKGFHKTIIITHRPIVNDGWYDEFNKIFKNTEYVYSSKTKGESIDVLKTQNFIKPFIHFASLQDLRSSNFVNSDKGLDKNLDIFQLDWDCVIIDEAHEGTTTTLADNVIKNLCSDNTKVLELSGTPFNLLDKYDESNIYTWNYVMEQEAKANWDKEHFGDSNPYSCLPKMVMYVYSLGKYLKNENFVDIENSAFNFSEFFKINSDGNFVYESEIINFLDLISEDEDKSSEITNMPFSSQKFRSELRHTLWTLPSRAASVALEKLLNNHHIFKSYNIANLSDDISQTEEDMKKIRKAITNDPDNSYSITLTVRKGTVGTTVKEWTGILVLNNTESAQQYLQTIFRVQSPYSSAKGEKERAYVFDFAPDRSLKMVAQASRINTKAGALNNYEREANMKKLLNFLPIISVDGSVMAKYDIKRMLSELKRAQAERAVLKGFDDSSIYNDELLKLTNADIQNFEKWRKIIGTTKQTKRIKEVVVNKHGMSHQEYELAAQASQKPKKELTDEELEAKQKLLEARKQKEAFISVLRGVSIRIPLMIYGMDLNVSEEINLDNFTEQVDEISWKEFMPKGITKAEFEEIKKYYDPDVFVEAARRIRLTAVSADDLSIEDRINKITNLFANFKNPDKETVLTPWNVVNMHLGNSIGGYRLSNQNDLEKQSETDENSEISYVEKEGITEKVFNKKSRFLDINSKTGLYPLYVAYSLYRKLLDEQSPNWHKNQWHIKQKELWQSVLENNIFVLSKTPMARTITYRTLNGYTHNEKVYSNLIYIDDLVYKLKTNFKETTYEILKQFGAGNMKFDVVIGNPPYQENLNGKCDDGSINPLAIPIYPLFFELAKSLSLQFVTLIFPARWLSGAGKGMAQFSETMLNDTHISDITVIKDSWRVFPNTDIKGGVLYLTYDFQHNGKSNIEVYEGNKIIKFNDFLNSTNSGIFIPYPEIKSIFDKVNKIEHLKSNNISKIISEIRPYGLSTDFFKNPKNINYQKFSVEEKKMMILK